MQLTLKQIATKIFIALMALQIINLSIDSVEFQPIEAAITIGDFNYLNSMTEYVSEVIMGIKDAFPEFQKESTAANSQILKHISLKHFENFQIVSEVPIPAQNQSFTVAFLTPYTYLYFREINPPPPKL